MEGRLSDCSRALNRKEWRSWNMPGVGTGQRGAAQEAARQIQVTESGTSGTYDGLMPQAQRLAFFVYRTIDEDI